MDFAVDFNNQLDGHADKINDKKVDGMLATKLHPLLGAAQVLPERLFSRRGGFAVFAGASFCLVPGADIGVINVLLRAA